MRGVASYLGHKRCIHDKPWEIRDRGDIEGTQTNKIPQPLILFSHLCPLYLHLQLSLFKSGQLSHTERILTLSI